MKKIFLVIVSGSFILFACNNENKSTDTEAVLAADTSLPQTQTITTPPTGEMPAPANSTMDATAPATIQQPSTAVAAGMNPAHGAPGHRCEIAVGAPLNSTPAAKPADASSVPMPAPTLSPATTISPAPAAMSPTPATIAPSAAPVTTLPGMNPPHGQPGHDCAIKVGEPLKK